nr:MAG: hypothetical protein DIU67_05740 [Actinomycetota bacterium]
MPTTRRGSALLAVCLILAMLFSSPAVPARAEVEAPRFLYVLAPPYGIFFDLKLMIVDTEGGAGSTSRTWWSSPRRRRPAAISWTWAMGSSSSTRTTTRWMARAS